MNIKSLKQAFYPVYTSSPADSSLNKEEISRSLVSKYADGNVSLQAGRYATASDIAKQKKEISAYDFTKP